MQRLSAEDQARLDIAEDIGGFTYDPLGYAYYAFPWGEPGELENEAVREWQAEVLDDIGKHLSNPKTRHMPCQIARSSGHGIGKLHGYQQLIDTPQGIRRWGDLKPGDMLFSEHGAPLRILQTHHYQNVPMYRVTFDDGSHCDVSSGHLWNVRGRKERRNKLDGWRTMETIELLRAGVKRSNGSAQARQWEIPVQGAAQFEEREIDLHPYLVGVWLGDGSKGDPEYTKPHSEVADRLRWLGYQVNDGMDGTAKYVAGIKHLMIDPVFQLGSHERYIPDDYKYNTVANRMELFRGLCDTDGEVHASGSIGYSSTSRQLAEDVIWLARSLGFKAMMHPTTKSGWHPDESGERVECRDCYRVTINCPVNPFTVERRRQAYKPSEQRYTKRWIESIEPIPNTDGMCVTVDSDTGLYLANDFIVTHNSGLIGMIIKWGMDTCVDTRVIVTANTDGQLKSKTVPEVTKWANLAITSDWFTVTATTIYSKQGDHQKSWRCDFLPWSVENTEAFAGLHNKGRRIIIIFDEASAIDDKIWEVVEGALTDENTEIIWICFGNPTRNIGRFRECWRKESKYWNAKKIDSRQVEGTNKEKIAEWQEKYGEDSDWFRVRVRGEFPSASASQFIPTNLVDQQRGQHLRHDQYEFAPLILTCDPAWWGDDDIVIGFRQGLYHRILEKFQKNDNDVLVANKLMRYEDEYQADAVFIDQGYGTGIYSVGHTNNRKWQLVSFGSTSGRIDCFNKRAEMLFMIREWLQSGGVVDPDDELYEELIALETVPTIDGKYKFPPKDDMKEVIGRSPNCLDQLGLTFAQPVVKKQRNPLDSVENNNSGRHPSHGSGSNGSRGQNYDPIGSRS